MRLIAGIVLAILGLLGPAAAQVPDMGGSEPRPNASASTDIPIKMPGGTEVMGAETAGASTTVAPIALEQPIDPDTYICGPGDSFELNFWGQQNFRLKVTSDLEGRVFISKVGFVAVAGKTLTSVRGEVNKKVRRNYPGLEFALTLLAPRTFTVHVAENVQRPGGYTATPVERVASVLARSGITGSRRLISIKRKTGVIAADLVMYEMTGDTRYNPFVLDGDVITVPTEGVVVTAEGAVRRPGRYELTQTKDIAELLVLAGGFKSSVVRTLPIKIVRRNASQQESFVEVAFVSEATPNAELRDDDRLVVRSSVELQRTVQLIGAVSDSDPLDAATTAKRLPFIEGDTVLSLIDRAGGVRAPGDLSRSYISRPTSKGAPELIPLDLEALLVRRDFRADKPIHMGDLIVVPPMQYSVRVEGAVARSGLYPYNPKYGITEYVATAGGRTRSARDLEDARVIQSSGQTRPFSTALKPAPGDSILVPERTFTRPEIVQIALSAAGLLLSGVAITFAATR